MHLKFLVLQLLLLTKQIQCSGKGEIKLVWYRDFTSCGDKCDLYLKNVVIQDEDGNEFLNIAETDSNSFIGNSVIGNKVYFSNLEQLDEVIPVNIHAGRSITISFEVWDKNIGATADNYERSMTDLVVPFSGITIISSWNSKPFRSDTNAAGDNKEANLIIYYRILSCDSHFTGSGCSSCVANYYGTECSKYCKPAPGKYTCGSSGEKVCEERRTGDNCDTCSIQYQYGDNCSIYCKPNEHYMCTEFGHKICVDNSTSVANKCRKANAAQHDIGVWISSGVAAIFFITSIIMAGLYIHLRRKLENVSARNVIYVNTAAAPNPAEAIPTTGLNYSNVVLGVTAPTNGHLYNDVVLQTELALY